MRRPFSIKVEMNYTSTVLGPIYRIQGTNAVLTVDGQPYAIRLMDKTAGVSLSGPVEIETIRPAAAARVYDILQLSLTLDQLDRSTLLMNGTNWLITSCKAMPSPMGTNDGEVYMFLELNQ
jgi:hypothetical protein